MAEFKDVIKQQKRMCDAMVNCGQCPLIDEDCACRFSCMIEGDFDSAETEMIERIVMDWAEKNPEVRYPTWKEWQEANFPEGCKEGGILPCRFVGVEEMERITGKECNRCFCRDCANIEISADIAEKLGIKPIGGDEHD